MIWYHHEVPENIINIHPANFRIIPLKFTYVRTHTHTLKEREQNKREGTGSTEGRGIERKREEGNKEGERRIGWLIGFTEQTCYIVPKEYEMYYVGSGKRHMHNKTLKQ